MAKSSSKLPNSCLLAAAVSTNMCLLVPGPGLAGEQTRENSGFPRIGAHHIPVAGTENSIDDVFVMRWAQPAKDVFLGADGKDLYATDSVQDAESDAFVSSLEHISAGHGDSQFDILAEKAERVCELSRMSAAVVARHVVAAAEKHGVDPGFALAVATAERNPDRLRDASSGERRSKPLMPATAEHSSEDDSCDPAADIDEEVRLLRELFDSFENPLLVAAAYSAGEARVRAYGGIPPFPETLAFVAEVINRQLGLREKSAQVSAAGSASASAPDISEPPTGSIATAQRRRWVGGVMHF